MTFFPGMIPLRVPKKIKCSKLATVCLFLYPSVKRTPSRWHFLDLIIDLGDHIYFKFGCKDENGKYYKGLNKTINNN